jgi:multiple antibiotic resistance protein
MELAIILTLTISLFFILDPFASLPAFLSVTKGLEESEVKSYANKAVIVAAILLFVFMFLGSDLMSVFGITMESFRVAGGMILVLMGIETVFGYKMHGSNDDSAAAWVIIATPILTGPGVITASVIFSSQYGIANVMIAGLLALLITWVILRMSTVIMKIIGQQVIGIVSKIIGLLIAAMGVEYILRGATEWFKLYGADAVVA